MSELTKVTEQLANNIANTIELTDEALNLLDNNDSPADFFKKLVENTFYTDAILFLSNALPKREAVWWACVCARHMLGDDAAETDTKALEVAEAWVYKPVQEVCEPTYSAAEATEFKTPAGWAAISAFWSGENISPSKEAVVPPSADLTGKAVNGAVQLAAVLESEPDQIAIHYQSFLNKGIDIANGGDGRDAS